MSHFVGTTHQLVAVHFHGSKCHVQQKPSQRHLLALVLLVSALSFIFLHLTQLSQLSQLLRCCLVPTEYLHNVCFFYYFKLSHILLCIFITSRNMILLYACQNVRIYLCKLLSVFNPCALLQVQLTHLMYPIQSHSLHVIFIIFRELNTNCYNQNLDLCSIYCALALYLQLAPRFYSSHAHSATANSALFPNLYNLLFA